MSGLTDSSLFRDSGVTSGQQAWMGEYRPMEKLPNTTIHDDPDWLSDSVPTSAQNQKRSFDFPKSMPWTPTNVDSAPLQIWEGTVLQVDREAGVMYVLLDAKIGQVPRHTADIDFQWVSDQDEDLVLPGAVFYLTLFKRTKRGSIQNSQELRFRRRPSWSPTQLKHIDDNASELLSKMKALPIAE